MFLFGCQLASVKSLCFKALPFAMDHKLGLVGSRKHLHHSAPLECANGFSELFCCPNSLGTSFFARVSLQSELSHALT